MSPVTPVESGCRYNSWNTLGMVARTRRQLVTLVLTAVLALTACDGYIEQATIDDDGSVEFAARATVVCDDPLQVAIWDGEPCDVIDGVARGGTIDVLPLGAIVDGERLGLVTDGSQDRRRIDATWSGTVDEIRTVLVSGGTVRADGDEVEATFSSVGAPAAALRERADLADLVSSADWPPAEFRVIVPELVVDHNGDDIQGRTVIWTFDGTEPDELRVVWSTSDRGLRVWWWIVGGALLTAVLFMMIVLERPDGQPAGRTTVDRSGS